MADDKKIPLYLRPRQITYELSLPTFLDENTATDFMSHLPSTPLRFMWHFGNCILPKEADDGTFYVHEIQSFCIIPDAKEGEPDKWRHYRTRAYLDNRFGESFMKRLDEILTEQMRGG